jgi:hypothetical protein
MSERKIFLSYCFDDEKFVDGIYSHLAQQPMVDTFFYPEQRRADGWAKIAEEYLQKCNVFVLFVGAKLGESQSAEALKAQTYANISHRVVVLLPTVQHADLPNILELDFNRLMRLDPIRVADPKDAEKCAREIIARIGHQWDD